MTTAPTTDDLLSIFSALTSVAVIRRNFAKDDPAMRKVELGRAISVGSDTYFKLIDLNALDARDRAADTKATVFFDRPLQDKNIVATRVMQPYAANLKLEGPSIDACLRGLFDKLSAGTHGLASDIDDGTGGSWGPSPTDKIYTLEQQGQSWGWHAHDPAQRLGL